MGKAFEKWYKQYKYSGDFATTYCEDGWKAALEWAYKTGKELRESAWIFDYIEKELGQDGFEKNI